MSPVNEVEEEEKNNGGPMSIPLEISEFNQENQHLDNSYEDFEELQINDEGVQEQNLNND